MAVIAAHLPMLLAVAAANTALRRALVVAAGQSLIVPYSITALYYADLTILAYLIAVWSARVLDEQPQLERREREAEILQRRLADAQLAHLQQQLRPHFLFNALGTVAELAHEAPAAAKRMLHNVIALLESAVAQRARGEVSVREELQLLQPYLEIQRLRFEDWLELEQEIGGRQVSLADIYARAGVQIRVVEDRTDLPWQSSVRVADLHGLMVANNNVPAEPDEWKVYALLVSEDADAPDYAGLMFDWGMEDVNDIPREGFVLFQSIHEELPGGLATEMLRAGASLPEVGQVLRHRSARSTAIYAKVDEVALRPLARPWPGTTIEATGPDAVARSMVRPWPEARS